MIAKRLQSVDSSAIRGALRLSDKNDRLLDLSVGFPAENTPGYIKKAGIKAIRNNLTRYTVAHGLPALRRAVASKLQEINSIEASEKTVSIVPGLTTGIMLLYLTILDHGDEVIIADPYFPPYKSLAGLIGAKAVAIDTYPDFCLTAEKIAPHITAKTKLLIINTPNNPTGSVYKEEELRRIAELAGKHNLIIGSDEVYEDFVYEQKHFSIGSIYEKTVTMNSFSKSYGMSGWRVGYMNAPKEVASAINELLQYTVFSSSSISQAAATKALDQSPKLDKSYRTKRDYLYEKLGNYIQPGGLEGAYFAFLKLPSSVKDGEFTKLALEQGVIILPGSTFSAKTTHVRLSYGGKEKNVIKGIDIVTGIIATA